MTSSVLLDMLRFQSPTVLMGEANDKDLQGLAKELLRWHSLASREVDHRIKQHQAARKAEEASHV